MLQTDSRLKAETSASKSASRNASNARLDESFLTCNFCVLSEECFDFTAQRQVIPAGAVEKGGAFFSRPFLDRPQINISEAGRIRTIFALHMGAFVLTCECTAVNPAKVS